MANLESEAGSAKSEGWDQISYGQYKERSMQPVVSRYNLIAED